MCIRWSLKLGVTACCAWQEEVEQSEQGTMKLEISGKMIVACVAALCAASMTAFMLYKGSEIEYPHKSLQLVTLSDELLTVTTNHKGNTVIDLYHCTIIGKATNK